MRSVNGVSHRRAGGLLTVAFVVVWTRHHPGFFREPPGPRAYECECGKLCTMGVSEVRAHPEMVISHHHLNEQRIQHLYDMMMEHVPKLKTARRQTPVQVELYV